MVGVDVMNKNIKIITFIIILIFSSLFLIILVPHYLKNGLPYLHTDEYITSNKIIDMIKKENFILDYFKYPGFNFYYGIIVFFLLIKLQIVNMVDFFSIRVLYVMTAILSNLILIYVITKITKNIIIGLIVFILSITGFYIYTNLYYAGPDTLMYALGNVIILFIIKIYYSDNSEKNIFLYYLVYCIIVGIAISTKFHGILLIIPLLILHILKKYYKSYKNNFILFINLIIILLIFIIFNFSMFTDFTKFLNDIIWNIKHYKGTHIGMDDPYSWYTYTNALLLSEHDWMGLFFIIYGIMILIKKKKIDLLVLMIVTPFVTILFLSRYQLSLVRNISFCIPFMYVFIGVALNEIFEINNKIQKINYKIFQIFAVIIIVFMVIKNVYLIHYFETAQSSLIVAEEYIKNSVPEGSRIFLQGGGYCPKIDKTKYIIIGNKDLKKDDYVIDSSYSFGRFYNKTPWFAGDNYMYITHKKNYENNLNKYILLKEFKGSILQSRITLFPITYKLYNEILISKTNNDELYLGPTINIYRMK